METNVSASSTPDEDRAERKLKYTSTLKKIDPLMFRRCNSVPDAFSAVDRSNSTQRRSSSPAVLLTSTRSSVLRSILSTPNSMSYFRKFLQSEHASENLDFWLAVESFKQKPSPEFGEAKAIYDKFLSNGASQEINIPASIKRDETCLVSMETLAKLFQQCQDCAIELLASDNYLRFLNSKWFEEMFDNAGLAGDRTDTLLKKLTSALSSKYFSGLALYEWLQSNLRAGEETSFRISQLFADRKYIKPAAKVAKGDSISFENTEAVLYKWNNRMLSTVFKSQRGSS